MKQWHEKVNDLIIEIEDKFKYELHVHPMKTFGGCEHKCSGIQWECISYLKNCGDGADIITRNTDLLSCLVTHRERLEKRGLIDV